MISQLIGRGIGFSSSIKFLITAGLDIGVFVPPIIEGNIYPRWRRIGRRG